MERRRRILSYIDKEGVGRGIRAMDANVYPGRTGIAMRQFLKNSKDVLHS